MRWRGRIGGYLYAVGFATEVVCSTSWGGGNCFLLGCCGVADSCCGGLCSRELYDLACVVRFFVKCSAEDVERATTSGVVRAGNINSRPADCVRTTALVGNDELCKRYRWHGMAASGCYAFYRLSTTHNDTIILSQTRTVSHTV